MQPQSPLSEICGFSLVCCRKF